MVLSDLPNGKSLAKCFLIDEDNKYTLNQRICCFRGFEGSSVYLKNIINRNPYLLSFDNGKGQTNLRKGDVEKIPIPLPPLPLQRLFAQRIEQIEREKSEVQNPSRISKPCWLPACNTGSNRSWRWFPHTSWSPSALKGQPLLAQGNALGIMAFSNAPCKGKSFVYCPVLKAFARKNIYNNNN